MANRAYIAEDTNVKDHIEPRKVRTGQGCGSVTPKYVTPFKRHKPVLTPHQEDIVDAHNMMTDMLSEAREAFGHIEGAD